MLLLGPALLGAEGGAAGGFELHGIVTGDGIGASDPKGEVQLPPLLITLLGVDSPFIATTRTSSRGRFQFHDLAAGSYTAVVIREGLGEIRRTVVIGAPQADQDGRIQVTLAYSAAEAAANAATAPTATVSVAQLEIPEKAQQLYRDAERRLSQHDTEGAVDRLEQATRLAPGFASAWNTLGVIAFQSGDVWKAEQYYRRALEAEPGFLHASLNLGAVLLRSGRKEEALAYNQFAARELPEDALANAQLGMNYFQLGDMQQAERYLLSAKRIDPDHFSQPQLFLANIYARRGDRVAAVAELRDLLQRNPASPVAAKIKASIAELTARP